MSRVKDWMMDQGDLTWEAVRLGKSEEEALRYVKKFISNGVIDETFVRNIYRMENA